VPLPLCSCGVVPSTIYLSKNGASKGATISFLISTPQTGIDSIIATYGMMGWVFAIYRPVVALIMGVVGGIAVGFVKDVSPEEKTVKVPQIQTMNYDNKSVEISFKQRVINSTRYSLVEFLDDISLQFIVGLLVSGMITYFIPEGFFRDSPVNNGILGMLLMMAIGIPMYVCATASIPIALTLMMKGFSPGVAFVFLVTGPATNAASLTILTNTLGKKVTGIYLLVIALCSIGFGYLLNYIFEIGNLDMMQMMNHMHSGHEHEGDSILNLVLGIVFFVLILASVFRKFIKPLFKDTKMQTSDNIKIPIEGMTCNHCVMNVKKSIESVNGVTAVEVNLAENAAYVSGDFKLEDISKAVEDVGYKVN
jgi:hypothetical protein